MRRLLNLIVVLSLFSSCAFHSGMMNDSASLHGQDFELIGMAIGQAGTTHVFGIGGLEPMGLVSEAKQSMYNRYPLKKGQTYANVSVDFKRSYFFIVNTTWATVTADIVQFGEAEESGQYQKLFEEVTMPNSETFMIDTSNTAIMINGDLNKVTILSLSGSNRYSVRDMQGIIYENIRSSIIYNVRNGYYNPDHRFKIGDKVRFIQSAHIDSGTVLGIAEKKAVIKTDLMMIEVSSENIIEVIE